RLCKTHELFIHLIGHKDVVTAGAVLLPHRNPGIGDNTISVSYRFLRGSSEHDPAAIVARPLDIGFLRLTSRRHSDIDAEAKSGGGLEQRMQHVVAISGPGEELVLD